MGISVLPSHVLVCMQKGKKPNAFRLLFTAYAVSKGQYPSMESASSYV